MGSRTKKMSSIVQKFLKKNITRNSISSGTDPQQSIVSSREQSRISKHSNKADRWMSDSEEDDEDIEKLNSVVIQEEKVVRPENSAQSPTQVVVAPQAVVVQQPAVEPGKSDKTVNEENTKNEIVLKQNRLITDLILSTKKGIGKPKYNDVKMLNPKYHKLMYLI
jgi:hypothetical protein